jgi:hypothetical protein
MNDFGVMTQRNIAASSFTAQHESLSAVQIKGTQSFPTVFCYCSFTLLRLKSRDINLIIIYWAYIIHNSYGRTNVIVRLSRCVIPHHIMKAYGNADFKLYTF